MLKQKLEELANSEIYPFHMPGHKRLYQGMNNPYEIDITEIYDFDNLHEPEGCILEEMQDLAKLYGASKSYILVNGSTCGNLAAIFAATKPGDSIIIGRNAHKSVYHGAEMRQLKVHYVFPKTTQEGIVIGLDIETYREIMDAHREAKAIVVTSPTYEGYLEPLDEIVKEAHKRNMIVIVDAAHGAHLGFHSYFPDSPLQSGADVVIMSLHKTLPALTQTAVVHLGAKEDAVGYDCIDPKKIEKYLSYFQTSSPSYVLMTSVAECIDFLKNEKKAFEGYVEKLQQFYKKCENLQQLQVLSVSEKDPSKIVISTANTCMTGQELQDRMRKDFAIELEMSSFFYALAMTSVMDSEEGFERLYDALAFIDMELSQEMGKKQEVSESVFLKDSLYGMQEKVIELWEVEGHETKEVSLAECEGRVVAKEVALYPPGVPVLVPGERITKAQVQLLEKARNEGLTITGMTGDVGKMNLCISVVN